jgi:Domain of unknown function (DUF5666)
MKTLRLRTFSLFAAALIVTAACGGSGNSPAGPSSADPGSTTPPAAGATLSGTVSTGGAAGVQPLGAGLAGIKITVSGTDLSVTTGSSGAFTLRGVPPGLVRLLFQGAGASGSVEISGVSQTEEIKISVVVNGATIEVESQERVNGSEAQLEGKVVSANYAGRTLVVGTTTVSVPEGTPITKGSRDLDLADVIVGAQIHVKGARAGDAITASRIIVQQTGLESVTMSGTISDLGGTCPNATFKFGSTAIAVNSSTQFVKGACSNLANGLAVEVKGLRRTDGSILATMVKFDDKQDERTIELSGALSNLGGKCPARTFDLGGYEVRTNGSTTFVTPCATLANGQSVQVQGRTTGNGKANASEVK